MPQSAARNPDSAPAATDAELEAIRNLMGTVAAAPAPATPEVAQGLPKPVAEVAPQEPVATIKQRQARAPSQTAPQQSPSQPAATTPKPPSRAAVLARQAFFFCLARIKAYRPERKRILLTSLVLMLLLKPFFVIGWTTVAIMAVVVTFAIMGADEFWRKVVELYQRFARWRPDTARVLKLRAYVWARKWNRLLRFVPDGLADQMRPPDLRELMVADAKHASAMQDRLQRLNKDDAIW